MADQSSNDNSALAGSVGHKEPDPHGQAAMLLTESILHGLITRAVITVPDAVEIVDVSLEVKEDIAADLGDSEPTMRKSLTLLRAIRASLSVDIEREIGESDSPAQPS